MARYRWLSMCALLTLALQAYDTRAQDDDDDAPGSGRQVNCLSELGSIRVDGDLQIAGSCTLSGTDVRGDITLFAGGSLTARDARIRGNLEGSRADFVDIDGGRIDGNVRLDELVGDSIRIEGASVNRDVELTRNRSRLEILNNDVGGDLHVFLNTGGATLSGNAIGDDLRCADNAPAPTGVGNRVDGETEGQCENLRPEAPQGSPPPAPPPPATPPAPAPTPPPASPPPASTPPPTSSTPPAAPAPPTPAPTDPELAGDEEGGAGSIGWPAALLLGLLAWRRRTRRRLALLA